MHNVFEYLGLDANTRPQNKVVQLVKHFDDVNKRAAEGIYHKKVRFPMYGQAKEDGVFAMVVVCEGEARIFGRTGKQLQSCEDLSSLYHSYQEGVYIAELCIKECSLEVLSGIVNPNRVNPLTHLQEELSKKMVLFFHDYLSIGTFVRGHTEAGYLSRYYALMERLSPIDNFLSVESIHDEKQLRDYAEHLICCGGEGAVFKQDVEWKAGAKDWHAMKIVRGVSYDLECIGYEEGTGKYARKVANLTFRWKDGNTIKAMLGKGWTHEDAKIMYHAARISNHLDTHATLLSVTDNLKISQHEPIGKIFEVYALQESSKGVLRLPKVGELRHDKTSPDF